MPKRSTIGEKINQIIEVENLRPTWAEVDLDALIANMDLIQRTIGRSKIFPVVKADAYGHGAVQVCKALEKRGLEYVCMALLEESIELKKASIAQPVLILGPLERYQIEECVQHGFTPSAYRIDIIEEIERIASRHKRKFPFHLKIDTGMGRLGFLPDQLPDLLQRLTKLKYAYVEGIFSNFSSADEPSKPSTRRQLHRFIRFLSGLQKNGISPETPHIANSSGILNFHESHLKAVRPGLLIYGINPPLSPVTIDVKPVLSLRSRIISIKKFPIGSPIGYGERFRTKRKSIIAVLPVGYDDGVMRALSPGSDVLLRGRRAPIIGAISMDLITIDVTDIQGVRTGDTATIAGIDGDAEITMSELARHVGTIPYEILCGIGRRVPRVYIRKGRITAINFLNV